MPLRGEDFNIDTINRKVTKAIRWVSSIPDLPFTTRDLILVLGKQQVEMAKTFSCSGTLAQGMELLTNWLKVIESQNDDEFLILMPTIDVAERVTTKLYPYEGTELPVKFQNIQIQYSILREDDSMSFVSELHMTGIPPQLEDAVKQAKEYGPQSLGTTGFFYDEYGRLCESSRIRKYL